MIKFTYMNYPVATFGTLYDDIWRGLPIARNLRLPQEEYYNGDIAPPPATWELLDNQQMMRDANYSIKCAKRRLTDWLSNSEGLPDNPEVGQTFSLPPLTEEAADAYNEILSSMQERNRIKNKITEIARRYSNTPFNIKFRNLP